MNSENELLDVIVVSRRQQTEDIISVEFGRPDGTELPRFEAGAHIDIHLETGMIRQYSICSDPKKANYEVAILRDPESRGGSIAAHNLLVPGQEIKISAPRNNFELHSEATESLLIAGGVGVTPLMSMAHQLQAESKQFEFHYCAKSHAKTAFLEELQGGLFGDKVKLYQSTVEAEKFDVKNVLSSFSPGCHIYVCGPAGFMSYVEDAALAKGWSAENIHYERFSAEVPQSGGSFTVIASESGVSLDVSEDETIVEVLLREGIDIDVSCEQGICGTCVTKILDGEAEHNDLYLSDEEKESNEMMMPCCSRAKGKTITLAI